MKVYTCNTFEGHYPVGTAAVIVAENVLVACQLLNTELRSRSLPDGVKPIALVEVDTSVRSVSILNDGNY